MKKWIVFILTAMALQVQAEDYAYKYLVLTNADGTKSALSVNSLLLTVNNGTLVATNEDGSQSFTLAQLATMYFAEDAEKTTTGISDDASRSVQEGPAEAYSASGIYMGTFESLSELKSRLHNGIYIVKQNGRQTKIIIRK